MLSVAMTDLFCQQPWLKLCFRNQHDGVWIYQSLVILAAMAQKTGWLLRADLETSQ